MTIEDESLLSAYMDGQLSPEQQQMVESAVIADPQLGEEFRRLSLVRDLVAGLSRDGPVDVSARVASRLRARSYLRRIWPGMPVRPLGRLHPARAAGMVSMAAMLLIGLMITFLHAVLQSPAARGPTVEIGPSVAVLEPSLHRNLSPQLKASESRWPSFPPHPSNEGATSKPETRSPRVDAGPSDRAADELAHVSQYLDNPDLRRVFLVAGGTDGSAQEQVASVVEETTRFNYLKITIARGIVIDPRHPGEATVFALVVSQDELETLRDRLHAELREPVQEAPADPSVVTQLADIGQVQACPPLPAAEVEIPRLALAIKAPSPGGNDEPSPPEPADPPALERRLAPTPEQERSSPRADQTSIVLVWVVRGRSG